MLSGEATLCPYEMVHLPSPRKQVLSLSLSLSSTFQTHAPARRGNENAATFLRPENAAEAIEEGVGGGTECHYYSPTRYHLEGRLLGGGGCFLCSCTGPYIVRPAPPPPRPRACVGSRVSIFTNASAAHHRTSANRGAREETQNNRRRVGGARSPGRARFGPSRSGVIREQ